MARRQGIRLDASEDAGFSEPTNHKIVTSADATGIIDLTAANRPKLVVEYTLASVSGLAITHRAPMWGRY